MTFARRASRPHRHATGGGRAVLAATALLAAACAASAQTRVYLRGQTDPLPGTVVRMDAGGIAMAPAEEGTTRIISWDRVRSVQPDGKGVPQIPGAFAELADGLFRARSRLERGDIDMAAAAAERLYTKATTFDGPSGALLAECVLRVRLARGAQAAGIEPWLHMVAARPRVAGGTRVGATGASATAATWVGGTVALSPVIDEASGLCPALPPIFSPLRGAASVRALVGSPVWARPDAKVDAGSGQARALELAAWYRAAAGHAAGVLAPLPAARQEVADDGLELVSQVVLARLGNAADRAKARTALERRLAMIVAEDHSDAASPSAARPPVTTAALRGRWVEAWCRAAIGLSLLREGLPENSGTGADNHKTTEHRVRAALELLHLPARFGGELPQLSLLALAEAASELTALGYAQGAAALEDELLEAEGGLAEPPAATPPPVPAPALKDRSGVPVQPEKTP